jgi:hypothetical protein
VNRGGIPDWEYWKDQPNAVIPNYYAWGYLGLMQAAAQRGEVADTLRYRLEAERWATLGR